MEINPSMIEEARKVIARLGNGSSPALPAKIPGFAGFFVAEHGDKTIEAVHAFKAGDGTLYKIGVRR